MTKTVELILSIGAIQVDMETLFIFFGDEDWIYEWATDAALFVFLKHQGKL